MLIKNLISRFAQCKEKGFVIQDFIVVRIIFLFSLKAAARHQCSYLVNLHVNDFLHVGGDPKWLNGLENAPQKLQNLGELNKLLAHRPWLITKEHIEVSSISREPLNFFNRLFLEQF